MKLIVVALALLNGAAAFTPSVFSGSRTPVGRTSTTMDLAVEDMLGADVETAGVWDPFGFAKDTESLYRRRCTEIKHGRVAQMATIGYVMGDCAHLPGYLSFSQNIKFTDVPAGMGALKVVPAAGWVQMFLFIGFLELKVFKQDPAKDAGDVAPKNWIRYDDPETKQRKLLSEIKNGRLAMMAIMGMMVQEMVTGMTTFEQLKSGSLSPFPDLSSTL